MKSSHPPVNVKIKIQGENVNNGLILDCVRAGLDSFPYEAITAAVSERALAFWSVRRTAVKGRKL